MHEISLVYSVLGLLFVDRCTLTTIVICFLLLAFFSPSSSFSLICFSLLLFTSSLSSITNPFLSFHPQSIITHQLLFLAPLFSSCFPLLFTSILAIMAPLSQIIISLFLLCLSFTKIHAEPQLLNAKGFATAENSNYRLMKTEVLNVHNQLRANYSTAPLKWNETLAKSADKYAKKCRFEHSVRF